MSSSYQPRHYQESLESSVLQAPTQILFNILQLFQQLTVQIQLFKEYSKDVESIKIKSMLILLMIISIETTVLVLYWSSME
jgi:hypothetical protein